MYGWKGLWGVTQDCFPYDTIHISVLLRGKMILKAG